MCYLQLYAVNISSYSEISGHFYFWSEIFNIKFCQATPIMIAYSKHYSFISTKTVSVW